MDPALPKIRVQGGASPSWPNRAVCSSPFSLCKAQETLRRPGSSSSQGVLWTLSRWIITRWHTVVSSCGWVSDQFSRWSHRETFVKPCVPPEKGDDLPSSVSSEPHLGLQRQLVIAYMNPFIPQRIGMVPGRLWLCPAPRVPPPSPPLRAPGFRPKQRCCSGAWGQVGCQSEPSLT